MRSRTNTSAGIRRLLALSAASLVGIAALSCGPGQHSAPLQPAAVQPAWQAPPQTGGWPEALPQDGLQPWEELDATGMAVSSGRSAGSINLESEFIPGVERFSGSGDASDNGEASHISSAPGTTSQAMYRIPLGGGHPGVVSVDANLLTGRGYYVGLADYGSSRWQWHGPFTDNHVRISTALQGPYTSSLGSLFVSVLVHNGSIADVVGIGVNTEDAADTTAPPQPTGLLATPVAGGLLLDWDGVIAGDLAGYRIYHSEGSFTSGTAAGVSHFDSLEGLTQHLLAGLTDKTHVRIAAVDFSGNVSALSAEAAGVPLVAEAIPVVVSVSVPSTGIGEPVTLSASGAAAYDFDTDGDGSYDITGQTEGSKEILISRIGIIRPRVRAYDGNGVMTFCGGVSVISANGRPVAVALGSPTAGIAPQAVNFSGDASVDFDGAIVGGGWDFDGDGTYDLWQDEDTVHVLGASYIYPAGVFNARLRVVDNDGAWDVDTVAIVVSEPPGNTPPLAVLAGWQTRHEDELDVEFSGANSLDTDGSIVDYEWDFDGNGVFNETGAEQDSRGSSGPAVQSYPIGPPVVVSLRVTDDDSATDTATHQVVVDGWKKFNPVPVADAGQHNSLAIVDGNPAISYYDNTTYNLKYVRATDSQGTSWGDPVAADPDINGGQYTSLTVVDGHPAISYHNYGSGDLMYVRALDAQGTGWGSPVAADTEQTTGEFTSMIVVDGNPAISYHSWTSADLRYVRALDAQGTAWGSPEVPDPTPGVGIYNTLVMVDGRPCIAYCDANDTNLRFVRAADTQGASWNTPIDVDTNWKVGLGSSMVIVDGNPAISYYDSGDHDLKYVRASNAQGTAWGTQMVVDSPGSVGANPSLAVIGGLPAISYRDNTNGDLKFVIASDAQGSSWETPTVIAGQFAGGDQPSLAYVDGRAAVCYYDLNGLGLMFALLY